jgi:HEAT repeat protein
MQRTVLPLLCALFAALIAGCGGTPSVTDENGERTYVDDPTLESMNKALYQLATAIESADPESERAMRSQLSNTAQTYQRALLSALYDDDSTDRRAVAGVMLGFTGDASVISALVEKIEDPDEAEKVRINSMLGLATLGDKLRDYPEHRRLMAALVINMNNLDGSYALRRAAINAYAVAFDGAQQDIVQPLRDRFHSDPSHHVRIAAINAMGDINDPGVIGDLTVVGLRNPEPEIRAASAIALGKITAEPARIIPALEAAANDENATVRRHAVNSIARHYGSESERVYSTVLSGLADFDERVRESAALALRNIGDERAVEPLLQATGDRTAVVREAAAHALGKLISTDREREAYPLVEMLADQAPGVRTAAMNSLEMVTRKPHGSDQARWRKFFYTKYPDLDPANMYLGKPKPRFSTAIGNSGNRARNTGVRTQQRPNTTRDSRTRTNQTRNTNQNNRPGTNRR